MGCGMDNFSYASLGLIILVCLPWVAFSLALRFKRLKSYRRPTAAELETFRKVDTALALECADVFTNLQGQVKDKIDALSDQDLERLATKYPWLKEPPPESITKDSRGPIGSLGYVPLNTIIGDSNE